MNKLVAVQRVSRALYSTEITQDFLKDLLDRAKKATTMPSTTPIKHVNNSNRGQGNSNRKFARGPKQPQKKYTGPKKSKQNFKNNNSNNNNNNNTTKTTNLAFHPMTSKVSKETILANLPKQPQFQKAGKHIEGMDTDLLDVLDNAGKDKIFSTKSREENLKSQTDGNRDSSSRSRKRNRNRSNQSSGFIYMKPISPTLNKNLIKSQTVPETFQVNPINRNSLFKFYPSLNVNTKTRWVNFILNSMNEADFPLYREPNVSYANLIKDQIEGPVKPNDIFTVKTPGFGKYINENSYSVKLEREPQVENIDVTLDKSKFNEMVLGKYESVKAEIKSSSNSHEARVELSLQQCAGLSNTDKEWLYEVCSGHIPLNQISK